MITVIVTGGSDDASFGAFANSSCSWVCSADTVAVRGPSSLLLCPQGAVIARGGRRSRQDPHRRRRALPARRRDRRVRQPDVAAVQVFVGG